MAKDNNASEGEPGVGFPLTEGERYEATVPDTLDLAERAELALNGLGGTLDPGLQHEPYSETICRYKTPYMSHNAYATFNCAPKYAESFPLLRAACGSERYTDRETGLMGELVAALSPENGLLYNPWHTPWHRGADEDCASMTANGSMVRAMLAWKERDGDRVWEDRIHSLVRGLNEIVIDKGDYAYYPESTAGESCNYTRSGWKDTDEPARDDLGSEGTIIAFYAHQVYGLVRWYEQSGDEVALKLARKLAYFSMKPRFWGDRYEPVGVAGHEQAHFPVHTHARTCVLRALLEYARIAHDPRIMEFVRSGYEFSRTLGIPRIGWLRLTPCLAVSESCVQADQVALGIRLSDMGLGDYWDDVDAVVRNALVEQQLNRPDLLEKVAAASPSRPEEVKGRHPGQECEEDVLRRAQGVFLSHPGVTGDSHLWVLMCCTGNGTMGLYYAWEGILRHANGTVHVNLLLNRASPWADVDSYLPYEGKVVIRNKTARRVGIRIPAWIDRRQVRATVSGLAREGDWIGNRVFFEVRDKDEVALEFPVRESVATYTAMSKAWRLEQTYTCTFRGSTLVDIAPRDEAATTYPFYLRDHLRQAAAPMKKVTRFVAGKIITNW